MFRLFFIVFWGPSRNETKDVQESPGSMTAPMMILAVLSILVGYVNTPWFGTYLGDWLSKGNQYLGHVHIEGPIWIPIAATLAFLIGSGTAWLIYGKRKSISVETEVPGPLYQILANKFYIDEFYEYTILRLVKGFGMILSWVEKYILQGIVSSVAYLINFGATKGANAHNGQMQIYGTIALIGLAAVLVIFAWTGGYIR